MPANSGVKFGFNFHLSQPLISESQPCLYIRIPSGNFTKYRYLRSTLRDSELISVWDGDFLRGALLASILNSSYKQSCQRANVLLYLLNQQKLFKHSPLNTSNWSRWEEMKCGTLKYSH